MPTSVALTPHFKSLAQRLVSSGKYNNVSEIVRDGLRLLELREQQETAKLKALRDAAKIGLTDIQRGNYVSLNNQQDIENFVRQAGQRASARSKKVA
jgi:antitoxin ParD1/3/4